MGLAEDIAKGMRKKKGAVDAEEGSPEEEASEPESEATAEGDDAGGEPASDDLGDYDSVEDSAVSDLMSTKDPKTFKAALRDFVKACMDREEE